MKAKEVLERVFAPKKEASFVQVSGAWENSLTSFLGVGQAADAGAERQSNPGMGVINMLDQLNSDIKLQQQEEEMTEANAEKEFQDLSAKTKESREAKVKDLTSKEGEVARLEEELSEVAGENAQTKSEKMSVEGKIAALHASCDFLLNNFDERKKARSAESESLKNSLAVLSGAVLEAPAQFFQVGSRLRHVRRH